MESESVRSRDEQIFDLLVTTQLTYAEIASRLNCSASTVSKHAKNMVLDLNLNPSILRTSANTRHYARYCQNILCHELVYLTASQIKKNILPFCSEICGLTANTVEPDKPQIELMYKKIGFTQIATELNISYGSLARIFEHHNINPRDFPENVLVTPANVAQRQTQRIKQRRSSYSNIRSGMRKHLGFTVRSGWENNFCLYLMHKKIQFEYEPKTFYFPERTGATAYLPDFKLNLNGKEVWVEIKGRMDSKDRTKMKRLKLHYPRIFSKMTYIVEKPGCKADLSYKKIGLKPFLYYNELNKEYGSLLKYWEN